MFRFESRLHLKDLLATLPEAEGGIAHNDISEGNHRGGFHWS
jgi:hypothetical protein